MEFDFVVFQALKYSRKQVYPGKVIEFISLPLLQQV